jgi:tetratricopeptide (TPR) repeat protein
MGRERGNAMRRFVVAVVVMLLLLLDAGLSSGRADGSWLGVLLENYAPENGDKAVKILAVHQLGPAAGVLSDGLLVFSLNGIRTESFDQFIAEIGKVPPGTSVSLEVLEPYGMAHRTVALTTVAPPQNFTTTSPPVCPPGMKEPPANATFYAVSPPAGSIIDPVDAEIEFAHKVSGCELPSDVVDMLRRVRQITLDKNVDYAELVYYTLVTLPKEEADKQQAKRDAAAGPAATPDVGGADASAGPLPSPSPQEACERGDASTCLTLGAKLEKGDATPVDKTRARSYYLKACDGGKAGGCLLAGLMLSDGEGGPVDKAQARIVYAKACDGGDAAGCFLLGALQDNGEGGPADKAQARVLYQKACGSGNAAGCLFVGMALSRGEGGPADPAQALVYYKKACDGGNDTGCKTFESLNRSGANAHGAEPQAAAEPAGSPLAATPSTPADGNDEAYDAFNPRAEVPAAAGQAASSPDPSVEDCTLSPYGGDRDRVIAGCTKLIEAGQTPPAERIIAQFRRSRAHSVLGAFTPALTDLDAVILLDPAHRGAYYERGLIYYNIGQTEKSIADFSKVIELWPAGAPAKSADLEAGNLAQAYLLRGSSYLALGHRQQAIDDFHKTREVDVAGGIYAESAEKKLAVLTADLQAIPARSCGHWKRDVEYSVQLRSADATPLFDDNYGFDRDEKGEVRKTSELRTTYFNFSSAFVYDPSSDSGVREKPYLISTELPFAVGTRIVELPAEGTLFRFRVDGQDILTLRSASIGLFGFVKIEFSREELDKIFNAFRAPGAVRAEIWIGLNLDGVERWPYGVALPLDGLAECYSDIEKALPVEDPPAAAPQHGVLL